MTEDARSVIADIIRDHFEPPGPYGDDYDCHENEAAEAILAALREKGCLAEWRPIDATAKNGDTVEAYWEHLPSVRLAWWKHGRWVVSLSRSEKLTLDTDPIGYRPLPPPPEKG